MRRLVLDTNVVVSGFLSPHGAPGQILYRVTQGDIELLYDARILDEYRSVLARPEFQLPQDAVAQFLRLVEDEGVLVIAKPLARPLPDSDDEPFLEVAVAARADCLVTGNLKHFPANLRSGMVVLSPTDFYHRIRS